MRRLLMLLALSCLAFAPAPLPRRPAARHALAGEWVLRWHTIDYAVTLTGAGGYEARSGGRRWYGSWRLEGRTLHVRETHDGRYYSGWSCDLRGTGGIRMWRAPPD